MGDGNLELVRRGYGAAKRFDADAITALLAPDVRWHAAGDDGGGCQNRDQALRWMREGIARGIQVDLVDARQLPDGRVLVVLQRNIPHEGETELPPPHGQIVTLRDGKIIDMAVYPTADEAAAAAGPA